MKTIIPYLICIVLGLLLARECNRDKTNVIKRTIKFDITIPEIRGEFDTIYKPVPVVIRKTDTIILKEFLSASDSLKIALYVDATKVREYKEQFKDSVQEVNVFTQVRGSLLAQSVDYRIFERTLSHTDTIDIEQKRHLYLLPQLGYNWQNYQVKAGASLLYIDRKNRLYSLGYDTNGFVNIGYGIKF
jgi:hypothetical protein